MQIDSSPFTATWTMLLLGTWLFSSTFYYKNRQRFA